MSRGRQRQQVMEAFAGIDLVCHFHAGIPTIISNVTQRSRVAMYTYMKTFGCPTAHTGPHAPTTLPGTVPAFVCASVVPAALPPAHSSGCSGP